ncbi:MAG TPA: SCO family protein [Ideonella sp.]|nr:SCO family protein [Ideonella sp.]
MKALHVLASLLLACSAAATAAAPALKAGVFEPPAAAPEFTLRGSDGAELKLSRFRGKLVALVFGFTHCPEVCPTTLATLAQARKALGADAAALQVVYVTVDPERDDVPGIRSYLRAFDPSFVGGTGTPEALAEMRKRYGVSAAKVPMAGGGYAMNHSSSVYLIDREGRLRALMPYGHDAKDFVHDFQLLLASR